jgi:hypothetical protein
MIIQVAMLVKEEERKKLTMLQNMQVLLQIAILTNMLQMKISMMMTGYSTLIV